jgi:allantoinase
VTSDALEVKRGVADGKLTVDVAFWGGLIPGSESELEPLAAAGVCGFKSFLVESGVPEFPPVTVDELGAALPTLARLGVPSLVHAEDPALLHVMEGDPTDYGSYLASRPPDSEAAAVELVCGLAVNSGARVHVLHISSAEAVARLGTGPGAVSGETCPHYLTFCAEEIEPRSTLFKCAPPIRGAQHRDALWEALLDGTISMVVSDHSPAPAEAKGLGEGDFGRAWGGIGSLQLRLLTTWSGAHDRGATLPQMTRWLATAPAQLAGLDDRKGRIEVGLDADFVVWDPDGATDVMGTRLEHRHPFTPYEGMRLRGTVRQTILAGDTVFDGAVTSRRGGRMLNRA